VRLSPFSAVLHPGALCCFCLVGYGFHSRAVQLMACPTSLFGVSFSLLLYRSLLKSPAILVLLFLCRLRPGLAAALCLGEEVSDDWRNVFCVSRPWSLRFFCLTPVTPPFTYCSYRAPAYPRSLGRFWCSFSHGRCCPAGISGGL